MSFEILRDPVDPNAVASDVAGQLIDGPLPCELLTCDPKSAQCIFKEYQPVADGSKLDRLVRKTCGIQIGNSALQLSLQTRVEQLQQLSINRATGELTFSAQSALFETLCADGTLDIFRSRGCKMLLAFFDENDLKGHNTLGNMEGGGNVALTKRAQLIATAFSRRDRDYVVKPKDFISTVADIQDAAIAGEEHEHVAQLGDEISAVSFVDFKDNGQRNLHNSNEEYLANMAQRIMRIFEGAKVRYAASKLPEGVLSHNELETPPKIPFKVKGKFVETEMYCNFALILCEIPSNEKEFLALRSEAAQLMMQAKKSRETIAQNTYIIVDKTTNE